MYKRYTIKRTNNALQVLSTDNITFPFEQKQNITITALKQLINPKVSLCMDAAMHNETEFK